MVDFVFVHIFKTAGITVRNQIARNLGHDNFVQINDGEQHNGEEFSVAVRNIVRRNATGIGGHFSYHRFSGALKSVGLGVPWAFSYVRSPTSRLVSAYKYYAKRRSSGRLPEDLPNSLLDPEMYFRHVLETRPQAIQNHMCRQLSGNAEPSFESAIYNIGRNFAFCGVTENIASTNDQFKDLVGFELDVSRHDNVSESDLSYESLPLALRQELDALIGEDVRLYDYLKEYNETSSGRLSV